MDGLDTESLWIATAGTTRYPPLPGDGEADVVVVGGGIAGVSAAFQLQRDGRSVTLVEADRICLGATARSTVKVTSGHGLKYSDIERRHGEGAARMYAEANQAGLYEVARLIADLRLDCGFERRDHVVVAESDEERDAVEGEFDAQSRAGLPVERLSSVDLPFRTTANLVVRNQAQFHPRKYVLGLADAFVDAGGRVYEDTRCLGVEDGSPTRVVTDRGTIAAKDVVIATQFPIAGAGRLVATLVPMHEYAVALPIDADDAPREMYLGVGGWSIRTAATDDELMLIVVGEKHKVGEGGDERARYDALAAWAYDRFGVSDVRYRWSTHDLSPVDGLPYVGRLSNNGRVFVVTGFDAWGMTNAAAAGLVLRDLVADRPSPWAAVFDPGRRDVVKATGPTLRHNFDVLVRWVGGRVERSRQDVGDVGIGEAAIVTINGEHVAVYRDAAGRHAVSASCTHLGCTVRWNAAERTWDCPCHGSRFAPDGEVVSAPAVHPLPPRRLPGD